MESAFLQFISDNWIQVSLILLAAFLFQRFSFLFIERGIRRSVKNHHMASEAEEKQREDTLISISRTATHIGIWVIAIMLILTAVGVQIGPLMAGAGIIGVALGFGAQSLVKDFLAGTVILAENQYRIGDVVQVNQEIAGVVEHFTLRETVLRDLDGMVHHIPNGNIEIATNMTMEYANVNLDVGVGYDTDLDKLEQIINQVGLDLSKDELWEGRIIDPPAFLRVDEFAGSAIIVKITGKTLPMQQWAITGELRKRLKKAFDKNGIDIPFQQVVIHKTK